MEMKAKVEEIKEKANELKEKAVEKAKQVGTAANEAFEQSPETFMKIAMIGGSVLVGLLSGAVNMESSKNKQCLVKDDVTGCNYLTKHPLNNSEILELENRMINGGETHGEALNNMGLLRKDKKRR